MNQLNPVSLFPGPKGENLEFMRRQINKILQNEQQRRESFFPEDRYETLPPINETEFEKIFENFLNLSKSNTPFFSPRYMAQMLKDPAMPVILGYLTFMLLNPNNHAYEGGPVTTTMEMQVTEQLLTMCGYSGGWGHLCSGGSLANLEALWAVRDSRPEGGVCFSEVSHYSWKRICGILRIPEYHEIPVDKNFRMDLNVLEEKLRNNKISCVVANFGSTGTGSVDDIKSISALKEKYNFHLHIDAAYGGFYRTLLFDEQFRLQTPALPGAHADYLVQMLSALSNSDSITVDPHKQGAISYGAGAVLYKDAALRSAILNSAPYTYHQQDKPNIGMFSLEGSRPGAMAAACYLTYTMLPLHSKGLGKLIELSYKGCYDFYTALAGSNTLVPVHTPDLDIVCFYKKGLHSTAEEINATSQELYRRFSVEANNPEFILSKFVLTPAVAARVLPDITNKNNENITVMRAVFIKHWNGMNEELTQQLIQALDS